MRVQNHAHVRVQGLKKFRLQALGFRDELRTRWLLKTADWVLDREAEVSYQEFLGALPTWRSTDSMYLRQLLLRSPVASTNPRPNPERPVANA